MKEVYNDNKISEKNWLAFAMKGRAFDFLNEIEEDIYTVEDGFPYQSEKGEILNSN